MSSLKSLYIYLFTTKPLKLVGPNTFYINENLLSLRIIHFEINTPKEKILLKDKQESKKQIKWVFLLVLFSLLLLFIIIFKLFIFKDYSFQKYMSILLFFL